MKEIICGDVLAFKGNDKKYKCLLCISTYKEKSPQHFTFAGLTLNKEEIPQMSDIINSTFYGIKNRESASFSYTDNDKKNIWSFYPEIEPLILGSHGFVIWRKDFMKRRDNFHLVGNLPVISNLDKNGNSSTNSSDILFLKNLFSTNLGELMAQKGQSEFKVKSIIKIV